MAEATASTSKNIGVQGKIIHSQGREIIANVLKFMKEEAANNAPTIPLIQFEARLLAATGVSSFVYRSIAKKSDDVRTGKVAGFSTPIKKQNKEKPKGTLRVEEQETIRSIIHNFYIHEKRRPTLKGIYDKILENGIPFEGGLTTLRIILERIGFKWQKTSDKRNVLMESYDIRNKRITYLRQLQRHIQDNRPIIFTDETYIHSTHTQPKEWSDNTLLGLKKPISKGKRLIIVHAGGKMGFVENGLLMFPSGTKSGDYHDDMNATNFMRWVSTQLLPNIPPRSVLVLDNASYHNVNVEKEPTSRTRKGEMIEWLTARNIPFDANFTKPELYATIKRYKCQAPQYKLDTLMASHGHSVLRLPPYHPEFNPIEKIWAIVKNRVASKNVPFKFGDIMALTREKISSITPEEWSSVCNHVDNVVETYLMKEHLLDNAEDELQFHANTGESDSDEDS